MLKRYCMAPLAALLLLAAAPVALAQTGGVRIGTAGTPDAAAVLDLVATDKGILVPRLTANQRQGIAPPVPAGLLVYQTDGTRPGFWYYEATAGWTALPPGDNLGGHTATQNLSLATYQLVGNGGSTGLAIGSSGAVTTAGPLTTGGTLTVPVGSDYAYAAARPLALLLGMPDFQSYGSYVALLPGSNLSCYPNSSSSVAFQAPVHLPQGAIITGIILVGTDNNATYDLTASVASVSAVAGATRTTIASASTTGNSTAIQTVSSATVAVAVDNTTTAYSVAVLFQPPSNSQLLNFVRVNYTVSRAE